jgi:sulfhydrogenase subunit beta (sulfur reductase)
MNNNKSAENFIIDAREISTLFEVLQADNYRICGPTIRDNAIVYSEITSAGELPAGWIDRQDKGSYRLIEGDGKRLFGYVVGPTSWKQWLNPPVRRLYKAKRNGHKFEISFGGEEPIKRAFVGVRACELKAIGIQDNILGSGEYVDPLYVQNRANLFLVAVNCVRAGENCFCSSMGTGPQVGDGFDLALTEMIESGRHYFLVQVGTAAGKKMLSRIQNRPATEDETRAARGAVEKAAANMGRTLDMDGLKELLEANFNNPYWEEIASRCLTCGNCTMVCPTCFCVNIEDVTSLTGAEAERWRRWDSCFSVDFSYIHGGSIRTSPAARYRQWMMHKLSYWFDQFGTAGCVGCGRCITWCPVGIDITEEAGVFQGKK